jgi:hypothetical protein
MGTKSFVQIEINAVFTTTSGKMQFGSDVFDHLKWQDEWMYCCHGMLVILVRSFEDVMHA